MVKMIIRIVLSVLILILLYSGKTIKKLERLDFALNNMCFDCNEYERIKKTREN